MMTVTTICGPATVNVIIIITVITVLTVLTVITVITVIVINIEMISIRPPGNWTSTYPQQILQVWWEILIETNVSMFHVSSSDVQMTRCSDVQMFRCSYIQMFRCSDVQMFRCSDVSMFQCFRAPEEREETESVMPVSSLCHLIIYSNITILTIII